MPITFSEQFNISKEVLEITGVFDVILDIDTRVFIDPALLELCTEPEFLDARKKVEKYFSDIITLLRHSKSQTDMYRKRAERMLTFTELSGTCFGYSQNGTGGNAIGSVLRKTILNTIQDLMTEGDTDPVLFELLGVFQEGIGCDRVSDLITLDAQVRRYTRAATQKVENLTNRDQNVRGNLNVLLTALSRNRRAGDLVDRIQPVFQLYEQSFLSEKSLWYRKRPEKRTRAATVLIQETASDADAAAQAAQLLRSEYGRAAIAAYVQGWLGDADVRYSKDLNIKDDKRALDKLSSQKLLALWMEFEQHAERETRLGLLQKISIMFRFNRNALKLFIRSPEQVIPYLQNQFYLVKRRELEAEKRELNRKLEHYAFDAKMDELTQKSLRLFRAELATRYHWRNNRRCFEKNDFRRNSEEFTCEYPVVLSTTYFRSLFLAAPLPSIC